MIRTIVQYIISAYNSYFAPEYYLCSEDGCNRRIEHTKPIVNRSESPKCHPHMDDTK